VLALGIVSSVGSLTLSLAVGAQAPAKVYRVGFLIAESPSGQASRVEAVRDGLRDLGYVEGRNVVIELRSAGGNYDRLPDLAAELIRLKVDVLVAFGAKAAAASKNATSTVPIVAPAIGDPVALGLTGSLARPDGNVTGMLSFGPEVAAKRLELLKEANPRVARVAVLLNPANATDVTSLQHMQGAAKTLKIVLQPFEAVAPKDLEKSVSAMAAEHMEAVAVSLDTLFRANARMIADLAATRRLPTIGSAEFARSGGLMGYGGNNDAMYRRAAYFVDRILNGAKPGDLPIEGATKFELVINLKTAKALGLTIPQSLLLRADEVIQ
jgi:ABC-type uncharacterized transport system substrate-binding protein